MNNEEVDVVVTRHPGLVEYLRRRGIVSHTVPVIAHATAEDLRGRRVCGVLPLDLAAECEAVLVVPLRLPAELRGVELDADQVEEHAGPPTWYRVERLS